MKKRSSTLIPRGIAISVIVTTLSLAISALPSSAATKVVKPATAPVVRIGFFANVTHAPALIAQQEKFFEKYLGSDKTKIEYVLFGAGPAAIEAMKGGAVDITYIGPNPSISGYVTTRGSLLRIISGATANGAQLVVREGISTVADLRGKKIASPQLGNTQDVALRTWLAAQGYKTSILGGGDVTVIPTENAQTLALFQRGDIDGAWLPEPWASRLVLEAGAKVFLDEKTLWPKGQFLTTNIIAGSSFLKKYPGTVNALLSAHIDAINFIKNNEDPAKEDAQLQIEKWTGKRLANNVITRAWSNLTFTWEPLSSSLSKSADDAVDAGLLTGISSRGLNGIYDLSLLNKILKTKKIKTVSAQGLGRQ
jgi:NitT/TauT family transport system substrate-binding protein